MKFNVFKWNLQGLFPLIALVIVILALSLQLGKVPPMGVLLNPFLGAVQNNGGGRLGAGVDIPHSGVSKGVSVYFDEREVPHIFAANTADLFFAQGYVTASLRLWQMDFLSYVSAGRLAEIFGQDYVDYDRNQR
ncbi:MAG TPA: penicillin acylase family protein, partial [Puia sp.]|nr:penicillin acylase family protein [Puia sp.]